MTKYTIFGSVLICWMATFSYGETQAQEVLEKPISLRVQQVTLREALTRIGQKADCKFIYSETALPLEDKVSINVEKKKLGRVLSELLKPYHVTFSPTEKYVYIREKPKTGQPTGVVNGKVRDMKTGEPLPGVSVILKGTTQGTSTNAEGAYSLNVVSEDAVLVFSFIGYNPEEVVVGSQTRLDIQLSPTIETLNQVVVVGYGEQQKKYVTGAISQVKPEEMNRYTSSSFAQQLAGKAAGVVINEASAQPGSDPQIVIRGIGTLTAGRNPLIVVDGFPLSEGTSLNSINPQDIESIDILKDPASAAIYGSRAANGVILITTKKAKTDQLSISLDAYTGVQERADNMELTDAYQSAQFFTESRDGAYLSKSSLTRSINDDRATRLSKGASLRELRLNYLQPYLDNQPGLTDTDWLDEIFRKAKMSSYNVAISSGTAKSNYYVSGNYFKQEGIVIGTGLERYTGTLKMDTKLSDRLTFGISATPSYQQQNYFENNSDRSTDPISIALIMYPFFGAYNPDGSLAISQQIVANTPEDGALAESPVAIMRKIKYQRNLFRTLGNTFLSYRLADGLTFKTMLGADFRNSFYDFYNPSDVGQYRGTAPKPASAVETNGTVINYLVENTLHYVKTKGDHSLEALAGYTFQKESGTLTTVTGSGIPDDNLTNIAGASAFAAKATRDRWTQVSYLGRLQYTWRDRYLLSAALRRDGSSRFGTNTKWGNFPSLTAGWILSEERFFPQTEVFTFAKLRASWGMAGNNQIGSYSSKALVGASNYVYGNTLGSGFAATTTPNPNLSWETKTSVNVGLDLSFWRVLTLTADYYTTVTKDLLLNVPVPEQSGYSSSIQNIGKVKNSGIELDLSGSKINLGRVKWGFDVNFSANKNEVMALAPGQEQILTGTNSAFRTRVGGPVAELYGYKVVGVYKSQEEINNTPHLTGTLPGDYVVEDVNKDGKVDLADKIGFGTYLPNFTYGISSNFAFQRFDLSFSLVGVEGRKVYDNALINAENGEGFSMPTKYYFENRYHPQNNPNGFFAQPNLGNFSSARRETRSSNMHFVDADYLRLRNIQLGYALPEKIRAKLRLSQARFYLTANNLFTLTKFRGFNPEATTDNVLTSGYSYSNYPVARSYVVGFNLTF